MCNALSHQTVADFTTAYQYMCTVLETCADTATCYGNMQSFALPPQCLADSCGLCLALTQTLLVKCPLTVPLLLEMLFLDPAHSRQNVDPEIKAAVQADAVDCLLQIALFSPGRALLEQVRIIHTQSSALHGGRMTELCACFWV